MKNGNKPKKNVPKKVNVCGDCSIWQARGDGYGTCVAPSGKRGIIAPKQTGNLSRKTVACGAFEKCCK